MPVRSAARTLATAVAAVAVLGGLAAATPAAAGPSPDPDATVNALRADADAAAAEYFDALATTQALDTQIAEIEDRLPRLTARRRVLQRSTEVRAVTAYKQSGEQLGAILASSDILTAARRTVWLDRLNRRDNDAFEELVLVTSQLEAQHQQLRDSRVTQAAALARVEARGRDIDAKLQAAEDRSRQRAVQTAQTPQTQVPRPVSPQGTPSAPPVVPPDYQPTPGTHPQHNDPFLVCTRAHEGSYTSYNPAGPYMGAYQFLQSTWNSAANHAGRSDLVGVPPHTASEYDQDDVAWALYQWRGAGPWGGRCV